MAAADFVIVPSRFEPCGLVAQAGVRYGAVPIVCAVGGLKDLVTPEVRPGWLWWVQECATVPSWLSTGLRAG